MIKFWIEAARLRTLPLAIANILMGNALALYFNSFSLSIFVLILLTAITLQVLSNFANDLGDSRHGADNIHRQGPQRMVQSGSISAKAMKRAVFILGILALIFGSTLIVLAFSSWIYMALFLLVGILSIWAAINYTGGSNPYGYRGYGDLSVFIFFGVVAVLGSFFLQVKSLNWFILLPASSCGLLSVAVLNINNIRDIESDRIAGKNSIPVMIGKEKAVWYHAFLLLLALVCACLFTILHFETWSQFLFLLIFPLLLRNYNAVRTKVQPAELDPYLKQMALTTLLFVLLFCFGLVF